MLIFLFFLCILSLLIYHNPRNLQPIVLKSSKSSVNCLSRDFLWQLPLIHEALKCNHFINVITLTRYWSVFQKLKTTVTK